MATNPGKYLAKPNGALQLDCCFILMKSLAILSFIALLMPLPSARADIYIVANKNLPIAHIDKGTIAAIYLLKIKHWENGEDIIPINLPASADVRNRFTTEVFDKTPDKLSSYWDQMLFNGEAPPITQNSEQALILFVERIKGAIGYVENKPQSEQIKILQKFSSK
jgi:ABC-type phosphate transport system substrate-binding protein